MIQKWKDILINWINCYFNESEQKAQIVTLESLSNIISHLRKNLSLDESKSSLLEAHTVEEFVREKYPSFKFDNGSVEARNEEDIFIVASLLLFFVCVNSKDVDLKNAMCSNLSSQNQETILRFSKCLMECSPILYKDVEGAILEACGQDVPIQASYQRGVAETPPALRSLHSEVRRLQAALDAERFDRNYLQEELTRTNLRVEKLAKEKENYKLEIVNLKAKISMCCGGEPVQNARDPSEGTARLLRQLEETEERLVQTQAHLDDAQYERDTYKAKIIELKQERDKWVSFSQQETSRVSQLSEELETERRQVQGLKDLVAELRQHNQLNRMDTSQLECDDPDTSVQSLQHNSSICSEACANVIEVQLIEERAKIDGLKQYIQFLQDQLHDLTQKSESEKLSYDSIISEKESDIFNLKHKINEEIEEKKHIEAQYSEYVSKLNNEINELEQKLKDVNNQCRLIVEIKLQEIQTLQEEKLSLLQSLNDETTKLENDIHKLNLELESEKHSKSKMKEDYENHVMKLNEKVLNRNNELVELQNNVFEKSEKIEALYQELRKEKQAREELMVLLNDLTQKSETEKLSYESIVSERENDIFNLKHKINEEIEEKNNMAVQYNENVSKLSNEIHELEQKLKDVNIECKLIVETKLQEIQTLSAEKLSLLQSLNEETTKFESDVRKLNLEIESEKHTKDKMKEDYENNLMELNEKVLNRNNELVELQNNIFEKSEKIEKLYQELRKEKQAREELTNQLNELMHKCESEKLCYESIISKGEKDICNLKRKIHEEIEAKKDMAAQYSNEVSTLKKEKHELEEKLNDVTNECKFIVETKLQEIQTLQEEKLFLQQSLKEETTKLENEIRKLNLELESEKNSKTKIVDDYESNFIELKEKALNKSKELVELQNNIVIKSEKIEALIVELRMEKQSRQELTDHLNNLMQKNESEKLSYESILSENEQDLFKLKYKFDEGIKEKKDMAAQYSDNVKKLSDEVNELEQKLKCVDNDYRLIVETKLQEIQILQEEKQKLKDENAKLGIDIQKLNLELEAEKQSKAKMTEDYENNFMEINEKVLDINNELVELQSNVIEKGEKIEALNLELRKEKELKEELTDQLNNLTQKSKSEKLSYESIISRTEKDICNLKQKINQEIEEKKTMAVQYSKDVKKLNNEKEKLEQMLKDDNNECKLIVKTKLQEIQTLHEEKLSMLQSFKDETTKLENDIQKLNSELETEKHSKAEMKKDYENHFMDLNEKVLNRNNELAELQNNVFEKNKKMDALYVELKKERQAREELMDHLNDLTKKSESEKLSYESIISEKEQDIFNLKHKIKEEIEENNNMAVQYSDEINKLKQESDKWVSFSQQETARVSQLSEELETERSQVQGLRDLVVQMKQHNQLVVSQLKCDNSKTSVQSLQNNSHICDEACPFKVQLNEERDKIHELKQNIQKMQDQFNDLTPKSESEKLNYESIISEKEQDIFNLKQKIKEEVEEKNNMAVQYSDSVNKLQQARQVLLEQLNALTEKSESEKLFYESIIAEREKDICNLKHKINEEIEEKKFMEVQYSDDINEMKQERDKWVSLSQQETTCVSQLSEELEIERRQVQGLKDQIAELTQNNQLNHKNTSQLDLETNVQSLQDNSSVRSETGANLTEVQQNEERAKIDIQILQDRLNDLTQKSESEKLSYESIISEREEEIFRLKCKIDEEIEKKNNMAVQYNENVNKLNNEIHELGQKLNDVNNECTLIVESKLQEILTLQEEKLSLLQSLKDETSKLENDIQKLNMELESEKLTKTKMEEDYENNLLKLNEKVLNRNSELVELQNIIYEKNEKIEGLYLELRKEKQKNEEIAELKKQISKMSATENRASQIIKVSAKYQAIILRRIAEIKSNTVLQELTNFGNTQNGENDLRRNSNVGTITMEDLEKFFETTDKHLKRCSEKQLVLQKERDRLTKVNRINESEIINLKKFLTELSVSFKTFSTVRDLYAQKFSRVVSVQRTVRREILSLDGKINDATMCKLERGYAAVMQDLSECVMNMERWVERCIGRAISPENIKQALACDDGRASVSPTTFQNTSLELQLEDLEKSFEKLLEEVVRASKGEGARDAQAITVIEVRAEYEDKLNRMKAKMKQLYQEQISVFKEKQKEEIALLERELAKTREKMAESSRAYEEHIKALTSELWNVGEKFLTKTDEVEWLRRQQRSGSLMSLQHVHSSGLMARQEEPSRPSDTHSLRSLPVNNNNNKREGRGLHMSDEEGEVFDNRWLKELSATPKRMSAASTPRRGTGVRLSELRWRNSLCPPHLKSSYPAETQFAPAFDEEDIKFSLGGASTLGGRNQRKEVGITAYKKPGPPTPSKQAGRLSATDSELRESLRPEGDRESTLRKAGTPSRLRALFRSGKSEKNDTAEGTPRSRRLSIFRKK